ncbi:serine threonine- kinase LMTK1-like isoform X1 [Labeo rohita]|uniref:non-specific serine/threonine protein kinase n=1 Tax=Labeo rohita TaxID=84645 RepID=A0A498ND12_LABRO|nr:serine threonine- kinase LMTK1-like isoform X1 [Labeo rohita]
MCGFIRCGSPLSELSWPSSLAVVAVSFSGLFTFVFLMLACLCCKKGDISFKKYIMSFSLLVQLLKSTDLGRHSLLYIKEMGHGWFGKVLLGEVNAGLSTTQVVVKELKASASVQEQMQFLEEVQPYWVLQHPALLQCLSQCSEVTPYLLVMEHCPLGDVKGYLRSCRAADSMTPDPLILQRMACEIASGLLYLHKHNYIHSDLALRNCLLTSELAVKIGDYGLSHNKYKDDYYVTADQIWVPLRWIAPELIDEVHGNLLVVDQTKASNVWSLGVTIWELFELGNQPYRHYSDRQVLTYAVKEQQLKLPKPLLKVPLCERWYEVMQFCWLQPEQRPVVEEVHLLLSYLCAKGANEAEEDFEKRWNSLRPSLGSSSSHRTPAPEVSSSTSSSFPLLEHFSMADSFQSENGDDILTVTETSQGLNFEYKWEQARAEQPYCSSSASGPLGKNNPHYQDVYYPLSNSTGSCKGESLPLGVSPSYYESDHPGVVPVLSAHSPSVSSEYYIRIEEPVECNINLEDTNLDYSPRLEASNSSLSSTGRRSPIGSQPNTYWSAAKEPIDSRIVPDNSTISLMEINDCSDDSMNIPSGVLADYPLDYAEVGNIDLTHRTLQRETRSRHCEETINLASSSSPCEAFSPDSYNTPIQPKSLDSGYDTENNESPEFILKDLEGNPALSTSVESDECDMLLQMDLDEDVDVMLLHPSVSHLPLISHGERNQYRDSAYFSDYDMENDKSPSEGVHMFFSRQDEDDVFDLKAEKEGSKKTFGREGHSMESEKRYDISVPKDNSAALNAKQLYLKKTNPNLCPSPALVPMISMLSPFPPEMGGCLTKESTPDDGIGLESDHSGEDPNSECYSSTVSEGSSSTQEASGVEEQANGDTRDFSSAESLGSDSTIVEFSAEIIQEEKQEACNKVDNPELPREGNEEKENSVKEGGIDSALSQPKQDESLEKILPALPEDLDVPAPLGNGEEADEEDSEDSDESDEELRSYNVQEQSDESDEELPVVPVIVSDRSSARHLRSLLKMPSILTQSFCDELESKKKAVSFFDDVTVFLFDQESPTGELGDYSFPVEAESSGQASEVELPRLQDRVTAPEDSPGMNASEESGAFQWQDDFPLMQSPSTSEQDSEEIATPPNSPVKSPDEKPAPPLSRFSVSRFSITHVSDSDMDSIGGNSENEAQE